MNINNEKPFQPSFAFSETVFVMSVILTPRIICIKSSIAKLEIK